MKKLIIAMAAMLLCLCMALVCAACTDTTPDPIDPPPGNDTVQPGDDVQETPASGELLTAVTSDDLLDRFEVVYVYGNDEIEDYLFWCEADITELYIVGLDGDADGWVTNGEHRFDLGQLKAGEALNYKRMVPEGFPLEAVIYTANGQTYRYAIGYNGRDGGISLVEIDSLFVIPDNAGDTTAEETTTTTAKTTTTTASTEVMAAIYWVAEDMNIFAMERTIESDSKWHVWKALKIVNELIPSDCSLLSADMLQGRDGIMVLNFSESFEQIPTTMHGRRLMLAIANTYVEFYEINAVRFQIEGEYFENEFCQYAEEIGYTDC